MKRFGISFNVQVNAQVDEVTQIMQIKYQSEEGTYQPFVQILAKKLNETHQTMAVSVNGIEKFSEDL